MDLKAKLMSLKVTESQQENGVGECKEQKYVRQREDFEDT